MTDDIESEPHPNGVPPTARERLTIESRIRQRLAGQHMDEIIQLKVLEKECDRQRALLGDDLMPREEAKRIERAILAALPAEMVEARKYLDAMKNVRLRMKDLLRLTHSLSTIIQNMLPDEQFRGYNLARRIPHFARDVILSPKPAPAKRGRPIGSTNKPKDTPPPIKSTKRGRPAGSKNKPRSYPVAAKPEYLE